MKNFNANRISSMPTSIFATIASLSNEYKAVNLGQGFPDMPGPQYVKEAMYKAIAEEKNQYAPSDGIFSLRKIISEIDEKYYGIAWNPLSEITITAGATEALFSTITAFIQEGDEVVMFEPFYDAHFADVVLAGGKPKYVTLHSPDFSFDKNEFLAAITNKTKMIIINTPHNPTGKVYTEEELQFIADIAIKNDILVVADEVYEFLTYDGVSHIPISTLPNMKERTITISSTGKTFGMTGWKVGYVCASPVLSEAIRKVHQWTTFTINTPAQHAIAEGFLQFEKYLPEFRKTYQSKKDLSLRLLKDTPFDIYEPKGSYFIMAGFPAEYFENDIHAAETLIKKYGVALIPPSSFYQKSDEGTKMVRICFAKEDNTLQNGINKLKLLK